MFTRTNVLLANLPFNMKTWVASAALVRAVHFTNFVNVSIGDSVIAVTDVFNAVFLDGQMESREARLTSIKSNWKTVIH